MKKKLIQLSCFLLLAFANLQSQTITLIAPSIDLDPDQSFVDLDIKVASFVNVSGAQFTLRWNPQVLEFDKIVSLGLNGLAANDNFGLDSVSRGYMTFYWFDPAADGETVPDGHSIFSFRMNVVGNLHSFTAIEFSNDPTTIELSDPDYNVFDYELDNGMISVGGLSNSSNPADLVQELTINPNPFKEHTVLEMSLQKRAEVLLEVFNQEGKLLYHMNQNLQGGRHFITLPGEVFPASGVYFLNLKSEEVKISKKLFCVQ